MLPSDARTSYRVAAPTRTRRFAVLGVVGVAAYTLTHWAPLLGERRETWLMLILACWAGIASLWFP